MLALLQHIIDWRCLAVRFCLGGALLFGINLIQKLTGGPTPTLFMILLLYGQVLCGLSSACGLAVVIWKGTIWLTQTMFYYGFALPSRIAHMWISALLVAQTSPFPARPSHVDSNILDQASCGSMLPVVSPSKNLPGPSKTSGRDSDSALTSEPTEIAQPCKLVHEPTSPERMQSYLPRSSRALR